jgi:hypothetical protein
MSKRREKKCSVIAADVRFPAKADRIASGYWWTSQKRQDLAGRANTHTGCVLFSQHWEGLILGFVQASMGRLRDLVWQRREKPYAQS